MDGDSFEDFEGASRTFWAVELTPGKEYKSTAEYDLRITQAVLPAAASDKTRSVVSIKFEDEDKEKETFFAVASLKLDTHDSQHLDLLVDQGQTFFLTVNGKNPVHLSGYYVPDNNDEDDEAGLYGDSEVDSDELGSEEEDDISEADEESMAKAQAIMEQLKKRKQTNQNGGEVAAKKAKVVESQQPKQQPKQDKPKQDAQKEGNKKQPQQKAQPKVLPNGLQLITTKEGTGATATKGRRVSVKYVGKLTKNGKVFDASREKPFVFVLGAREVITGWDLGVAGMQVGEKRTLIIPPELGYGKEGAGREIPPNSSLTFDVELVNVK